MIPRIAIYALIVSSLLLTLWLQSTRIDALKADNAALTLALQSAMAKQTNITEDNQSDAEIDNIPDDGLRDVPERWLRPEPGDGGLY